MLDLTYALNVYFETIMVTLMRLTRLQYFPEFIHYSANKVFICTEVERVNAFRAEHNANPLT